MTTPSPLGEPLELPCGGKVPNRFVKAAMNEAMGNRDGAPTSMLPKLYGRWADGGAAVILTGNVMIDRAHLGEPSNVVVEDERHLTELRAWAEAGQRGGGQLWMQINHPGRQSPSLINRNPVAPSAIPIPGMESYFATPRALTRDEIADIVRRFARTAGIAKMAGFGGVQIHGAHGYLISQFLSPAANHRTDGYGGDLEGRVRLLREVYEAIRAEVGDDYPVGVKLNSSDGDPDGFTEHDALAVAQMLGHLGVDLLEVSGGTYAEPTMQSDGSASGATFADFARELAEQATCPITLTGGFADTATMEAALRDDIASMVGVGRAMVINPDLPNDVIHDGRRGAIALPHISTGIKKLDESASAVMVNGWYELQMRRLARGQDPSSVGNGWAAIVGSVWLHGIPALMPRRA